MVGASRCYYSLLKCVLLWIRWNLTYISGADAWSLMPDELFLAVFAFLSKSTLCRCARVCRRWRRLAYVIT